MSELTERRRETRLTTATFLSLLSVLFFSSLASAQTSPAPGAQAPAFTLPDLKGRRITVQPGGRALALNFWAFWCDTWKAELPDLKKLAALQDELGFRLVTVSVDGTRVEEFTRRTGGQMPFPVLLDVGGGISRLYHVGHVPTVVIIGRSGKVLSTYWGYPGNSVVLSALRKALNQKPSGHNGGGK